MDEADRDRVPNFLEFALVGDPKASGGWLIRNEPLSSAK